MTGELFPGLVEELPSALAVHAEDDLPDGFDHRPIARLAVAQCVARGLRVGHRPLQPTAMARQDDGDQPDHRPEGEDAQRRRDLGRQIRTDRRELGDDRHDDRDDPRGDQRGLERAAVEEREREGDRHDRSCGQGGDGRRNRRGHQDGRQDGDHQQRHGTPWSPLQQLVAGVDQGDREPTHDRCPDRRRRIAGLDHDRRAGEREERHDDRHRHGEPRELPGFFRRQRDFSRCCSLRSGVGRARGRRGRDRRHGRTSHGTDSWTRHIGANGAQA